MHSFQHGLGVALLLQDLWTAYSSLLLLLLPEISVQSINRVKDDLSSRTLRLTLMVATVPWH